MTSRSGLELGPPEVLTCALSLEDKGIGGSGRVTEIQNSQSVFPIQKNHRGSWSVTKSDGPQRSPPSTYTYRVNGGKQPLVRALLGGVLDSPKEEEGLVATAANGSGACCTPSSPSQLEATRVEGCCSHRSEGGSPTAQKHFD
jgi:hypothetical protein